MSGRNVSIDEMIGWALLISSLAVGFAMTAFAPI
jgi:hypothetical protein